MSSLHEQNLRRQQERLAEEDRQAQESEGEWVTVCTACGMPYPCPSDCPSGTHNTRRTRPTPLPQSAVDVVERLDKRFVWDTDADTKRLCQDALTLIQSQREEIERLDTKAEFFVAAVGCRVDDIRVLQSRLHAANQILQEVVKPPYPDSDPESLLETLRARANAHLATEDGG